MHGLVTILSPPPIPRTRLNSYRRLSFWARLTRTIKKLLCVPVQGPGKCSPVPFPFRPKPIELSPAARRCPSDAWIFHLFPPSYSGHRVWNGVSTESNKPSRQNWVQSAMVMCSSWYSMHVTYAVTLRITSYVGNITSSLVRLLLQNLEPYRMLLDYIWRVFSLCFLHLLM
jgi:hypothetical protein